MPSDCVPDAGTTALFKTTELHTFHRNPRRGDVDEIAASLKINGQYKPLIGNIGTHTGRPYEILAGNHTLMAIRTLLETNPFDAHWTHTKVHWLDVDDDMCNRIVLVDNRSHDAGEGYDDSVVWELVQQVGAEGTGLGEDDLDRLESALGRADTPAEPPKPSLPGEGATPAISFTLQFDNEAQQQAWFGFVKWLADQYPDEDLTVADRLEEHLKSKGIDKMVSA